MTTPQFVSALANLAPTLADLEAQGVSQEFKNEFLASFYCDKRDVSLSYSGDDPVLRLISEYDVSRIDIGDVTFNNELIQLDHRYIIGEEATDVLILNTHTGEISLIEWGTPHVLAKAATDSSSFLDALIEYASFHGFKVDSPLIDDQDELLGHAVKCANAAGGEDYLPFWRMMMGC